MLILWNSKRLHIKGISLILLQCEGTILADLYTCWRQKYSEEALESCWGWCGRLEEIHGTVRRPLVSFRHQARDCWSCSNNHSKGSSTKHCEFLMSLRKSGACCSGNTQPWCAGWTHMPIFATAPVNHQPCYCASTPLVCWLNENYPWFWLFLIWLSLVRQIRN